MYVQKVIFISVYHLSNAIMYRLSTSICSSALGTRTRFCAKL